MKIISINDIKNALGRVNVKGFTQQLLDNNKPALKALVAVYVNRIDDSLSISQARTAVADKITQAIDASLSHNIAFAPVALLLDEYAGSITRFYIPETLSTYAFKQGIINLINEKIDGARV